MRPSWCSSLVVLAAAFSAASQTPTYRVTYGLEVVRAGPGGRTVIAAGEVSGPQETGLRLTVRTDSVEVEALLGLLAEADSVNLTGEFLSERRVGASRRGLPLLEQDSYRRVVRLAWGDTVRVYPYGPPHPGAADSLWVSLALGRDVAGGETRPSEEVTGTVGPLTFTAEAVVRPRRARVALWLVRGDTVSSPRGMDLIVEGPGRRVRLVAGRGGRDFQVALARPEPPASGRDRALALDADVVCLRVDQAGAGGALGVLCGRLNNVARRLPLADGYTLVATFAWPGPR